MYQKKIAYRIFRRNRAGNLTSFSGLGKGKRKYFKNKATKPKRGWPNLTCFREKQSAISFFRRLLFSNPFIDKDTEIWEVEIIEGRGHPIVYTSAISAFGLKAFSNEYEAYYDWPHGTIFAESITPIRRIDA